MHVEDIEIVRKFFFVSHLMGWYLEPVNDGISFRTDE